MSSPHKLPALPVYYGLPGRYVEIMAPTTEAPPEFHFAAFLAIAGILFAHTGLQLGGTTLYPTLYVLLAGSTGVTHKTTAATGALRILRRVDPELLVIYGLGSLEGILKDLENHAHGPTALWRLAEFTSLLRKANNKATSTLTELLLNLYDRPPQISSRTLGNPIKVDNPAVTILGDSTVEHLTETFSTTALTNGLLNRLSIFIGQRGDPIPFPPQPDNRHLNTLVADLEQARRKALTVKPALSPEALQRWDDIYRGDVYPLQQKEGGEVFARAGDRILQIALLYTLTDNRHIIEPDDLETGLIVTRYLADCTRTIANAIGQSDYTAVLDRMVEIVAKQTTIGGCNSSEVTRALSTHQRSIANDHGGILRCLENLKANGHLQRFEDGRYIRTELPLK